MPPLRPLRILPLLLSDEHIKRAAADMIRRHDSEAAAKAEEYIEGLNSKEAYYLAKSWEAIRDKIRELQGGRSEV